MRAFIAAFCAFASIVLLSPVASATDAYPAPLDVVMKRMKAINAKDLDRFLSTHSEDVAIFVYPDRPLGSGKPHLRKIFGPMIDSGEMTVDVGKTMVADSFVVVQSTTSFGDEKETGTAIYEVRDGLIRSVRFLRDTLRAKRVDSNQPE